MYPDRCVKLIKASLHPHRSIALVRCVMDNAGDAILAKAIEDIFDGFLIVDYPLSSRIDFIERMLGVKLFHHVILGGGTLIFTPADTIWFRQIEHASRTRKPMAVFGTGVKNPIFTLGSDYKNKFQALEKQYGITQWVNCLKRFPAVSVRGFASQKLLGEFGIDNVEVIGDPALHYSKTALLKKKGSMKIGINISIENNSWGDSNQKVYKTLLETSIALAQRGYRITYFPLNAEDLKTTVALMNDLPSAARSRCEIFGKYARLAELLDQIESMDMVIAVRLHAVIFSFCSYTPVIVVGYQPKHDDFMGSMGMQEYLIRSDEASKEAIFRLIDKISGNFGDIQQKQFAMCRIYKQKINAFCKKSLYLNGLCTE